MLIICFIAFAVLLAAWLVLPHSTETVHESPTYSVEMPARETVNA